MSLEEEAGRGAAGTSGPGWDGEGGVPISEELWLRALRLKESLLANAETTAHVAPCGDGTIHVYISIEGDKNIQVVREGARSRRDSSDRVFLVLEDDSVSQGKMRPVRKTMNAKGHRERPF
jgi:hypothetical protein